MGIYIYSVNFISEKLLPPAIRGVKHLSWLKVILKPIQTLWEYIFVDYKDGSNYSIYDNSTAYSKWQRVVYFDKRVYECIQDTTPGINCDDIDYWNKINDNFIGASERVRYSSQKITFEYALNKWFFVPDTDPQIYIVNNIIAGSGFIMGATGLYSSAMASSSVFSTSFMGTTYSLVTSYDYTIYVPILVFNAQGTTIANREQSIRNFADKYNLVGMSYNVVTY